MIVHQVLPVMIWQLLLKKPSNAVRVKTGIRTIFPEGYMALIMPKSGVTVHTPSWMQVGVIDNDLRGEMEDAIISHGDIITQLVIVRKSALYQGRK